MRPRDPRSPPSLRPELAVEFRALPEPGDSSHPPLRPPWEVLRDQCGRITRECFQPEHGRPAIALTQLINLVMVRERRDAATVISFADLHALLTHVLIGDDEDG
jgi:hypothetical protein